MSVPITFNEHGEPQCPRCHSTHLEAYKVPVPQQKTQWGYVIQQAEDIIMFHCKNCEWYDATSPSIDAARKERFERTKQAVYDLFRKHASPDESEQPHDT